MFALSSYVDCGIPVGIENSAVLAVEAAVLPGSGFLTGDAISLACHEWGNCFYPLASEQCLV